MDYSKWKRALKEGPGLLEVERDLIESHGLVEVISQDLSEESWISNKNMIYDSWYPRRDSKSYPQSTNPEHTCCHALYALLLTQGCRTDDDDDDDYDVDLIMLH